jgi:hypothetical protein
MMLNALNADYGKVAEIRYGKIKAQERLEILHQELIFTQAGGSAIKKRLHARILYCSKMDWYSPVQKMLQGERENFYILKKNYTAV